MNNTGRSQQSNERQQSRSERRNQRNGGTMMPLVKEPEQPAQIAHTPGPQIIELRHVVKAE